MDIYNKFNFDYITIAKKSIIKPKIKLELLNQFDETIDEITEDINKNSGSISINYQQGKRRSCNLNLTNFDKKYNIENNIFGFNNKFKLYTGLQDIETKDIYWFSQGVYYAFDPSYSRQNNNIISINGVDKFSIFGGDLGYNMLEGTYNIPADSNIINVIRDILGLDMGNRYCYDILPINFDYNLANYTTPYDIKKAPGTYMGEILIELANIMGADIYYDADGHLTISKGTDDFSYTNESSIWDFSDKELEYSNSSVTYNTVNTINKVIVVSNRNDGTAFVGTAENHNTSSYAAIEKIGTKVYYEESTNLYNQNRADEYARYLLNRKSIIQESINFNSSMLPHLDVNKIITITDKEFNLNQNRFVIQSLNIPLDFNSPISIQATNIATLPYYDFRGGN